jgi:hypothetical protein
MEDPEPAFRSFEEFWPFYVGQHTMRGTRALHFAGTTLGFADSSLPDRPWRSRRTGGRHQ